MTTFALVALLALVLFGAGWLVGRLGIGAAVNPDSLNMMEREFIERMRDVSLVGSSTVFGQADFTPSPDRYDISSV